MAPDPNSVDPNRPAADPGGAKHPEREPADLDTGASETEVDAAPWVRHLFEHLPIARAGEDPEGVHQVRVAVRRLEAFLYLAQWRALASDLTWLRRAAGAVRDLDVLLERGPPGSLARSLSDLRRDAREELLEVLDSERLRGLTQALGYLPALDPHRARARLGKLLAVAAKRGRAAKGKAGELHEVEEWHRLRRSLRKLRYCREWLSLPTGPLRQLQDRLGALGDAALCERIGATLPPSEAREAFLARTQEELAAALEGARAAYQDLHQAALLP